MSFSRYYTQGLSFQKANDLYNALNAADGGITAWIQPGSTMFQCDTEEADKKALAICSERGVTVHSEPPPRFSHNEAIAFSEAQRSFEEARERVQELNQQRQVLLESGLDPDEVHDVIDRLVRRFERIAEGDTELARLYEASQAAVSAMQPHIAQASSLPEDAMTAYFRKVKDSPEAQHYRECLAALDTYEAGLLPA